ncbi:MAG TPA: ABC transporter substrate-binding protein, partial [Actinomycetes bacterium]|nr:ABC transporter substrate-binding protein [Actinomycetes bacterium]
MRAEPGHAGAVLLRRRPRQDRDRLDPAADRGRVKAGGKQKQGYDLAIELVNKAGGVDVGGKKVPVELKLLDDTSDQAKAVNLAQRLITQDKVNFFLGTY